MHYTQWNPDFWGKCVEQPCPFGLQVVSAILVEGSGDQVVSPLRCSHNGESKGRERGLLQDEDSQVWCIYYLSWAHLMLLLEIPRWYQVYHKQTTSLASWITVPLVTVPPTGPHFIMLLPVHFLPAVRRDSLFHKIIKARMKPDTDMCEVKVQSNPDLDTMSPSSGSQRTRVRIMPMCSGQLLGCGLLIDSSPFHS